MHAVSADHSSPRRPMLAVGAFTAAYVLAATAIALTRGNLEFLIYIAILLAMIGAVLLVHRRLHLTTALLWMLTIWGLMHMAGGLVPVPESWPIDGEHRVLYSWWIIPRGSVGPVELSGWLKYDNVVHAYGYGVTTWFIWQIVCSLVRRHTQRPPRPTIGMLTLIVAAACGFGALNEVVEFIATLVAETNVGGYVNTGIDLIANMTGAIIAAIIIRMTNPRAQAR